jgi:hypothetical protein
VTLNDIASITSRKIHHIKDPALIYILWHLVSYTEIHPHYFCFTEATVESSEAPAQE